MNHTNLRKEAARTIRSTLLAILVLGLLGTGTESLSAQHAVPIQVW